MVETKKDLRTWDTLTTPLTDWMSDAINTMGFTKMTPVQASTIPLFMGSKDVVVEVQDFILPSSTLLTYVGSNWERKDFIIFNSRYREIDASRRAY